MKLKKLAALLFATVIGITSISPVFADLTEKTTQDTYISTTEAAGGQGKTTFYHYGNCKYDGVLYFNNTGSRTVKIRSYTPSGYAVYDFKLEAGKDALLYFNHNVLKAELCDGEGTVKINTLDGGTGKVYFRYNVIE